MFIVRPIKFQLKRSCISWCWLHKKCIITVSVWMRLLCRRLKIHCINYNKQWKNRKWVYNQINQLFNFKTKKFKYIHQMMNEMKARLNESTESTFLQIVCTHQASCSRRLFWSSAFAGCTKSIKSTLVELGLNQSK